MNVPVRTTRVASIVRRFSIAAFVFVMGSLQAQTLTLPTPQTNQPAAQTTLITPATSIVTPATSIITPATSVVTPATSIVTPATSIVTPATSIVTPATSVVTPQTDLITPQTSTITPQTDLITPQTSIITPQTSLLTGLTNPLSSQGQGNFFNVETKLIAPDATLNGFFGAAVKIGSNTAVVGAMGTRSGSVYSFTLVSNTWVFTQEITNPLGINPNQFGSSLALDGDGLVVGNSTPLGPGTVSGQANIFRRVGGTWVLEQTLLETNPPPNQRFGISVGISGQTVAVGNSQALGGAPGSGDVSIFNQVGTNWFFQTTLLPDDPGRNALFGSALAIKGDTLITSATGSSNTGAAYIFTRTGTTWTEQQRLAPDDLQPRAQFGTSVALGTNMAVVGAPFQLVDGVVAGAAYVFLRTGPTWTLLQTLTPPSNPDQATLQFGASVAIFNNEIVVGAPREAINGQFSSGAAYFYQFNGTNWVLAQKLSATDATANAQFGFMVDVAEPGAIFGAPFDLQAAQNAGAAYIDAATQPTVETVTASPNVLSPPDGQLVPVTITMTSANGAFEKCRIVSVTSNETLQRDTTQNPDVVISSDLTVFLRATTTAATGLGRIYLITVECTDARGVTTQATTTVSVPPETPTPFLPFVAERTSSQ